MTCGVPPLQDEPSKGAEVLSLGPEESQINSVPSLHSTIEVSFVPLMSFSS